MTGILINRTGQPELVAASDGSLTVTVAIRIKHRGLRKTIVLPDVDSLHSRCLVLRKNGLRRDDHTSVNRP